MVTSGGIDLGLAWTPLDVDGCVTGNPTISGGMQGELYWLVEMSINGERAIEEPASNAGERLSRRVSASSGVAGAAGLLWRPFAVLLLRREVIRFFVVRDLRARHVNSVLGVWWTVIQQLVLLLLYTFVFSRILNARFGSDGNPGDYALYLFCGLLPWLAFSESVTRSITVLQEQATLIKKVVFPSEILPVNVVLSALVVEFIGLSVLLVAIVLWGRPPGLALLTLPVVVLLQFLFTVGIAWLLATLTLFLPDVRPTVGLGLTLWMFATPIIYPASMVPERLRWALDVNPLSWVVEAYRGAVLDHRAPALAGFLAFALVATATFVFGHVMFNRSRQAFADYL
jgi:lipopolysaccharide transport system permease protein